MAKIIAEGAVYNWGNVTLSLFGSPVIGISKIEYKTMQKKENIYGLGRDVIGRGYGNIEYSGSIEILLEEWIKIINASPNGDPLQIAPFNITVLYNGVGVLPKKDILYNCEFLESPLSTNQGDTSIKVTIPILMTGIERGI